MFSVSQILIFNQLQDTGKKKKQKTFNSIFRAGSLMPHCVKLAKFNVVLQGFFLATYVSGYLLLEKYVSFKELMTKIPVSMYHPVLKHHFP